MSVQDALQDALGKIAGVPVVVAAAGRTDAGVHALEQVLHFDTDARRPLSAWVRGTNSELPKSIAVRWAHEVPEDFHARFCARGRSYRYFLLNRPVRTAVAAGRVGWFHRPLDVAAMQEASLSLLGEQDFSAFRAAECQANSPIKRMESIKIWKEGEMVIFDFSADAFLHHMVRNLVGCLVFVGKGKRPSSWVEEVMMGRDRRHAAPTFQADGLYLRRVKYDAMWNLPQAESD
jgi:tRNA pseudouridine38-40 synthase